MKQFSENICHPYWQSSRRQMINLSTLLSHHRTCRSAYGGSIKLMLPVIIPLPSFPSFANMRRDIKRSCITSEFHSYLLQVTFAISFEVVCSHHISLCPSNFENFYRSVLPSLSQGTMTSADF